MEWPKRRAGSSAISCSTERKVRSAACQVSATGQSQARSRWAWLISCRLPGLGRAARAWRRAGREAGLGSACRAAARARALGSAALRASCSWGSRCRSSRSWPSTSRPSGSLGSSGSLSSRARVRPPSSCLGLRSRSSSPSGAPPQKRSGRGQRQAASNRSPWCTRWPSTQSSAASAHQRRASRALPPRQRGGQLRRWLSRSVWPPRGQITKPRAAQSGRWRWPQG